MPEFIYKSISSSGKLSSGSIEAVDRKDAISALKTKGLFATQIEQNASSRKVYTNIIENLRANLSRKHKTAAKINSRELLDFTSQLHTALQSGLPLLQCLEIIQKQMPRESSRNLVAALAADVRSGKSFSQAIEICGSNFPRLYTAMIRAGETGGILEKTTAQLVKLLKRENQIRSSIKTAMAYPLCILTAGIISVIILVTMVLPRIVFSVADSVEYLPWPTRVLMGLSNFIASYYGLAFFVLLLAAGIAFHRWICTVDGKLKWDSFKLKLPLVGKVLQTISVGRFCRTLGALTSGGIVILEALNVVKDTMGNTALSRKIEQVIQKVKSGDSLADPLAKTQSLPPLLIQIVSVGEQTGRLDEMLLNAADTFEEKSDIAIERFTSLLPTVLVLILAVVVGFIVAATLLPIMAMEFGAGF